MPQSDAHELVERIKRDMHHAMKNNQPVVVSELKSLLARITNAEAIEQTVTHTNSAASVANAVAGVGSSEAPRKILSLADVKEIIRDEKQEIETTLTAIDPGTNYAAELREKLTVVQKYE
jgi:uncharacterized protein